MNNYSICCINLTMKSRILISFFCIISFGIVAQTFPCSSATPLTNITNYCSNNAQYTNVPPLTGTTTVAACWTGNPTQDVWLSFTATQTDVLISVNGLGSGGGTIINPCIALYIGPCAANLTEITCVNGTSNITQLYKGGLAPGTEYLIRISTTAANKGTFKLCVNNYTPTLNPGADCAGAAYICNKNSISVPKLSGGGSNTHEPELTSCGGGVPESNSCWYTFTCQTSGTLTFDLIPTDVNNDIDFIFYKLNGTNVCTGRTIMRCNFHGCGMNNGPTGLNSTSTDSSVAAGTCATPPKTYCKQVNLVAGTSYALFINDFNGNSGFSINWGGTSTFLGPVPKITASDTTICAGQSVIFDGSTSISWTSLSWNFSSGGNPVSATGVGPHTVTYNTAGSYVAILEGLSAGGCKTVKSINIIVSDIPTVTIATPGSLTCTAGSVSLSATANPLPVTYAWSGPGVVSGGTTANPTVNAPGSYIVTVTTPTGCTATASVAVTQQGAPTITTTKTDVSCNGGNNGTATVSASGGTAPYTYLWSPGGGTGVTVSALSAGTYTITVTDSKGCTKTATAVITEPTAVTATTSKTDVSCYGGNDGTATVSAAGGTTPYIYLWSPSGGTNATALLLSAGTYTVTVTDSKGCTKIAATTVTQPADIVLTTAMTPANCGSADGSASVTVSGGTPTYTYAWSPGGGTVPTISNIIGGSYTVVVTDSKGCTKTAIVIVSSSGSAITTATGTNVSCNGVADGTATASTSGGTAPYSYSWNSVPAQTTVTATGLLAGSYIVTVTDAMGCISNATVTITEPTAIVLTTSKTDANCGGADGSASVTASGGISPYTYSWNSVPLQTTQTANGLIANSYVVTVTDSKGCTNTTVVNVGDIGSPILTTSKVDVLCNGTATGSITTTVTSGAPPYTYTWSNSAITPDINNLPPGNYTLTVSGTNNCKVVTTITITEPAAIVLTTSETDANCGASDGSATVSVSGGVAPYSYSWNTSPVQLTAYANNIPSGGYSVTVTDLNGCIETAAVNINNIAAPVLSTSSIDVNCNGGNDGTATVSVTGGVAPYTYSWNSIPAQTTATATGLKAGSYIITVTAANGCKTTAIITILEPSAIVLTTAITNENCGKRNGTATVSASGGTAPYTYLWSTSPVQTTATATGLDANTYIAIVYDIKKCSQSTSATIINIPGPTADFIFMNACANAPVIFSNASSSNTVSWIWDFGDGNTSTLKDPSNTYITAGTFPVKLIVADAGGCKDSIIKNVIVYPLPIVLFGDTTIGCSPLSVIFTNNSTPAGSFYLWDFGDNSTSKLQTPSHTYTNGTQSLKNYTVSLTVTSVNGCASSITKNNLVSVYPLPSAVFAMNPGVTDIMTPTVNFYNQSVGNFSNRWTFGDGDSSSLANPVHTYKDTGVYHVCLSIVNSYGCPDDICSIVIIKPTWSFFIPNSFTPNGDLVNDGFRGYGENIKEYQLLIFDRWGNQIFKTNNLSEAWNGKANNGAKIAQQDVYIYVVILKDVFNGNHRYTGTVTLVK